MIFFSSNDGDTGLPLKIALNNGDGTFSSAFESDLSGTFAENPLVVVEDFNNDGRDDIAMIGISGDGTPPFIGKLPQILLSNSSGGFDLDTSLGDAYLEITGRYGNDPSKTSSVVYSKSFVASDFDNDGDIDLFLEANGEHDPSAIPEETVLLNEPHFWVNDGTGNFTINWGEALERDTQYFHEDFTYARHEGTGFGDFNGDGYQDIVLGPLHDYPRIDTKGLWFSMTGMETSR